MSLTELPRISVITPALDGEAYISDALTSLQEQDYPDFESIVIDGGSVDNTVSISGSYPFCEVIVRHGAGLYAALNEGLRASTGAIICFLNSDDLLTPGILRNVGKLFTSNPDLEIVGGQAVLFEDDASGVRQVIDDYSRFAGRTLEPDTLLFGAPIINAHFFRADIFKKTGNFDTSYRLAADREFMLRCYMHGLKVAYVPALAYQYRRHPGSLTLNRKKTNTRTMGLEHLRIADELRNSGNEELRRQSSRAWDDAALTVMAACLRNLQLADLVKFCFRFSTESPLFMLRLPLALAGKIQRRIQARRQHAGNGTT